MSFLKKLTKIATLGLVDDPFFGMLGGNDDLAKNEKERLRRMEEQNKLNASNEANKVTQFEDAADSGGVTDNRRKKKAAGGYSSNIGLSI